MLRGDIFRLNFFPEEYQVCSSLKVRDKLGPFIAHEVVNASREN